MFKDLIGQEMTILELSHKLVALGLEDIYDFGTVETNILEENSITVGYNLKNMDREEAEKYFEKNEEFLVEVKILEKLDGVEIARIKVLDISEI